MEDESLNIERNVRDKPKNDGVMWCEKDIIKSYPKSWSESRMKSN